MRLLAFICLSLCCVHLAIASPKVLISDLSWSSSPSTDIPDDFEKVDTNTTLPLKESYWVKIVIESTSESTCILTAGSPYMQGMSYYDGNGEFLFAGNNQQLVLEKGENTFYIHYPFRDFKSGNNFDIDLHDRADFYRDQYMPSITGAIFIAIILFLFFLSFSFYVVGKFHDTVYLYYAWYLGSIAFFFSYQYGFLGDFFPMINTVSPSYVWISSASLTIAYLYFAQAFLDLKNADHKVNRVINFGKYFVVSVVLVETITYFFGVDIQHSVLYKSVVMIVQIVTMPYILYRCYLLKTPLSWIFISGALILAVTTLVAQTVSTFRAVADINLYVQIGLLIEVFIFSIGIGMRMVLINIEKRATQNRLIDQLNLNEKIQEDFIKKLENKVHERTTELQKRNEEKEVLLREIHHRVKNNLQTISSLLNIQLRKLHDPAAISAIKDSKSRVQVMGLLHKFLYQHEGFEDISIKPYLEQLIKMLVESHKTSNEISAQVSICNIKTNVDLAINIGLIVNELTINSLKHAKPSGEVLTISLEVTIKDEVLKITLSDNGVLNNEISHHENTGFGWRLVNSLVDKIEGKINVEVDKGLTVEMNIPLTSAIAYVDET